MSLRDVLAVGEEFAAVLGGWERRGLKFENIEACLTTTREWQM